MEKEEKKFKKKLTKIKNYCIIIINKNKGCVGELVKPADCKSAATGIVGAEPTATTKINCGYSSVVELLPSKQNVASSNLVTRSK